MKPVADRLLKAAAEVVEKADVRAGDSIRCAFSGGVDSMVLLHLLQALQLRFGFVLEAAHVHHGLSPNADTWANFCRDRCQQLSIPISITRVEVERQHPAGLEAAAREIRLRVLETGKPVWLAFGHHQDDQVETMMFRLLRGTGVQGAAAMVPWESPKRNRAGRLRPLLTIRRKEIVEYAHQHRLDWVEDESNVDCSYARNRLRQTVFPVIETHFPAAVSTLARAADHFREAAGLLDELATDDQARCGGTRLYRNRLMDLSDARICNLLRRQMRELGAPPPTQARLLEIVRQLREDPFRPLYHAFGKWACCAYRDTVWLEPVSDPPESRIWRGEDHLPWANGTVFFRTVEKGGISPSCLKGKTIELKSPWPGILMKLKRNRPSRRFKNLCQEAGIPPWHRNVLPVLSVNGTPAWIAGIGIAIAFAAEPGEPGLAIDWDRTIFDGVCP